MDEIENKCALGKSPQTHPQCKAGECPGCGWHPEEIKRREKLLETYGLTLCEDGLHRLILCAEAS